MYRIGEFSKLTKTTNWLTELQIPVIKKQQFDKYTDLSELTLEIVHEFIEKIVQKKAKN